MWRRSFTILTFILILHLLSCSSGIKLQFQQPAQDRLVGIKQLVIAPCKDSDDAALICSFLRANLDQINYFESFDQNKFSLALEQNQLSYEKIRQADSLGQIGKLLNVDGVIFSEVKKLEILPDELSVEKVQKSVWTGEYERDESGQILEEASPTGEMVKKKKYKLQTVDQHVRIRNAVIAVNFQLLDLQKGSMALSKELTENYTSGKLIKEESQKIPTDDEIKRTLAAKIVRNFIAGIAPKIFATKRVIEKGTALIDSGAVHAKNGQWKKAEKFWDRALKLTPTDARVYYNLGLAFEAQGEYDSAERYYKQASLLNTKKKLYQQAIQNLRKRWQATKG